MILLHNVVTYKLLLCNDRYKEISVKKAYVFLAEGFEEIEAVTPADIMRRAGIQVILVSCSGQLTVNGAHGVPYICDALLKDVSGSPLPDAVVLPGGMPGSVNLAECEGVKVMVEKVFAAGGLVSAICAAPAVALARFGVLNGRNFTCYPEMEKEVPAECTGVWKEDRVVADGNLITSRGPGTAGEFGFALVDWLLVEGASSKLRKGMLYI